MKEIELGLDRGRDRRREREGGIGGHGRGKKERGTQSALIGILDAWEVLMHVKRSAFVI